MTFLSWDQTVALAEAHPERYHALIYLAVDSGMRWSELIGLRRSRLDLRNRKVRVTEQLIRLDTADWLRKEPKTGASIRSITISSFTASVLADHLERFALVGLDGLVFPQPRRSAVDRVELLEQRLLAGHGQSRRALPVP
jgi:integrase